MSYIFAVNCNSVMFVIVFTCYCNVSELTRYLAKQVARIKMYTIPKSVCPPE